MYSYTALALLVLATQQVTLTAAVPLEERGGEDICGSGIYGELAPYLKPYPLAQAFCTAAFPPQCTTEKAKKRSPYASTSTTSGQKTTTPKSTSSKTTSSKPPSTLSTTTATSKASTTADKMASAFSKCRNQPGNVISTLCSCIEYHKVRFTQRRLRPLGRMSHQDVWLYIKRS